MIRRPFPVQDSTHSGEALAARVLSRYRLGGPVTCRFFRKSACDTYKVEAGHQQYYLKVYRFGRRTRKDVTEEVRLLNYLDRHGVSVARAVMRQDGLYVNRLAAPEGTRYAVLFEAAQGVAGDGDQDNRIRAYGEMVARMHHIADRMRDPYSRSPLDMRHLVDDNVAAIAPRMAHREADLDLIHRVAQECKTRIGRWVGTSKPQYGICHGDLHGGDVCYDTCNRPVLFDFDSSGYGWRALDIGVFLASHKWMDVTREAEDRRQRRLATFLEGYSRIRKLGRQELSAVQLGPPVRHIYLMGFVLRYTTVYEGEHWADEHFIDWHMEWFQHWAERNL